MRKSVIAVAAIGCLVLAAGAGAASRWVITSTNQIKPSVLSQLHGARGATGARGPAGVAGAPGAPGSPGAPGVVPGLITVDSPQETISSANPYTDLNLRATCPSGYSVVGTGVNDGGVGDIGFVISYGTFVGGFISNLTSVSVQVYVQAICGQVAGGSSGANAVHRAAAEARYEADLRTMPTLTH